MIPRCFRGPPWGLILGWSFWRSPPSSLTCSWEKNRCKSGSRNRGLRCPIKKCVLHIDYLKNIPKKCGCASRIFQFILAMDGKTTIFLWERLLGSQEQLWRYFQMECWQNTSGEPTLMLRIDGMMFVLHRHSEQKQHTTMQKSVVMQVSVCRTRSNVLFWRMGHW